MKNIILASGSPRRKELLKQIGLDFSIIVSGAEEITSHTAPDEVVKELSYQKARDIFDKTTEECIVIGADTVVYAGSRILGKPASESDWRQMLNIIQGNRHFVYTGVSVLWRNADASIGEIVFSEATGVDVHSMTDEEINQYILTGEASDKAGGYGIQGLFAKYIDRIEGDYNNVVGLPVARLYQEMKNAGLL